jgi:regulator of replication initiation timing
MPTHHIIIDDLQAEIDRLKQENLDLRIANDRLTRANAQMVTLAKVADRHIAELTAQLAEAGR